MKSRRYVRHLLALSAVALAGFVVVRIYLNLPKAPPVPDQVSAVAPENDLELKDVAFTETENGQPVWALKAERASYKKSGQSAELEGLEVVFFDDSRLEGARLIADFGDVDLATHEVVARGNVTVATPEGARFATDQLRYRHGYRDLVSENAVTFTYKGIVVRGTGMTYTLGSRKLVLGSEVTADVPVGHDLESRAP